MTRLEKVIKEIMRHYCPADFFNDEPGIDEDTAQKNVAGNIVGCRGIMCAGCWLHEENTGSDLHSNRPDTAFSSAVGAENIRSKKDGVT